MTNYNDIQNQISQCRFEIKISPEQLKDPKIKSKVRMVCECLAIPDNFRGKKVKIKEIAESYGYNVATAYRDIEKVKKGKWLIKPTKNFGQKIDAGKVVITVRVWDKRAAEMAIQAIIQNQRNHVEKLALYERICNQAQSEGLKYGSYKSFLSIHNKISKSIIKYRDQGVRGLREDIIPAIRRDHTAYRPMECLIGDQHKADYYCFDYNGDVVTLELFCWLDFRTQMAWGSIAYKNYNRYIVGQALLNAARWGIPSQVYTDWGKPEESKYIQQLIDQLSDIGIGVESIRRTRAKTRHPQAKPIEAWFGRLDKNLKNENIPGYCKRLRDSRENELQQKELKELIKTNKLLTIEEMTDRIINVIEKWNDHLFKNRVTDTGKSPRQIYQEEIKTYPVTTLSSEVLNYIFLPFKDTTGNGKPLKVQRSQVKLRHEFYNRVISYFSPTLTEYNDLEVSVRFNPFNPERVWIFDKHSGKLICKAEEWQMINPKDTDQVSNKIAIQERLIGQIRERYKSLLPDKKSKVRVIHPLEREAREIIKTEEPNTNTKSNRYRPLNFFQEDEEIKTRPLFQFNTGD